MLSALLSAPKNSLAVTGSNALTLAPPPPDVEPVPVRPTRTKSSFPVGPTIVTVSPMTNPARFADALSIATSLALEGMAPSRRVRPSSPSGPFQLIPNAGPDVCSGSPFSLMIVDSRMMFASTRRTPSMPSISSMIATGTGSRCARAASPKAIVERISKSTSPRSSSNKLLIAPFTLSVRMKAPETKATPLTTARMVKRILNLRASTPRNVSRTTGDDIINFRDASCGLERFQQLGFQLRQQLCRQPRRSLDRRTLRRRDRGSPSQWSDLSR